MLMDMSILLNIIIIIIINIFLCISCPLLNKTKLKFGQDFEVRWSSCFELKLLNVSKYSIPRVRCAFGNVVTVHCLERVEDLKERTNRNIFGFALFCCCGWSGLMTHRTGKTFVENFSGEEIDKVWQDSSLSELSRWINF